MPQIETPYGWHQPNDEYEGSNDYQNDYYSEDYGMYDTSTESPYDISHEPTLVYNPSAPHYNVPLNTPGQSLPPSAAPEPSSPITTTTTTTLAPILDPARKKTSLPIQPIQPGIFVLGPTEVDQPLLMPLWLPLWMVILIGIGLILLTSLCCCCCFRFRIWQIRLAHYSDIKKMQKKQKKREESVRAKQAYDESKVDTTEFRNYGPPPDYKDNIETASCDPSIATTATTVQPPTTWAHKLLPSKMAVKRQKNYEKRVLKKIQEETIDKLPKCEDLGSVKVSLGYHVLCLW